MNVGLIDAVKSTAGQLYNAVNSALPSSKLPKDCLPQSSKSCTPDGKLDPRYSIGNLLVTCRHVNDAVFGASS